MKHRRLGVVTIIVHNSPRLREERMSAFVYLRQPLDIGPLVEAFSSVIDSADFRT
jgi:hypothetical protein